MFGIFLLFVLSSNFCFSQICDSIIHELKNRIHERVLSADFLISQNRVDSACFLVWSKSSQKGNDAFRLFDSQGIEREVQGSAFSEFMVKSNSFWTASCLNDSLKYQILVMPVMIIKSSRGKICVPEKNVSDIFVSFSKVSSTIGKEFLIVSPVVIYFFSSRRYP
jgi:hypothetical protein